MDSAALASAIRAGKLATVKKLLPESSDPNALIDGAPLISIAAQRGRDQVIALLLDRGADPNAVVNTAAMIEALRGEKRTSRTTKLLDALGTS
ncbi:MAG TPA: hypothetical protein VGM90_02690 [Kofleriaceae bacterium]|jgi:ankyrin repeat protein